jgi:membrane associated rhomboid family serine protease
VNPFEAAAIGVIVVATLYAFVRKAPLSLTYAIAVLSVYAIEEVSLRVLLGELPPLGLLGVFAPYVALPDLVLSIGPAGVSPPWTWITFQFLHASLGHLLLNLMGLVFIAPVLEDRIGSTRWAILFLGGGAFGAGVFLVLMGFQAALVGASAGILALFGAFGRLYPRERVRLFLPLPGIPAVPVIALVIVFLVLELLLGLDPSRGVAWQAHVGGIVFGFAVAPVLLRLPLGRTREVRSGRLPRIDALRGLATTPDLQSILAEAERADLPEIRMAWVDKFVAAARCPECRGPLRKGLGGLSSECGWKARLG